MEPATNVSLTPPKKDDDMPPEEYCRQHAAKLDDLHEDVKAIAAYVPKIEILLSRMADINSVLAGFADVNKDQYRLIRQMTEQAHANTVRLTQFDGRLEVLENSRKGIIQMITPAGTAVIVGLILVLLIYMVTHGIIPAQYSAPVPLNK